MLCLIDYDTNLQPHNVTYLRCEVSAEKNIHFF